MIRNPNGSEYRTSGTTQQYTTRSSLTNLFNLWDEEAIKQGGSPIYYYQTFISIGEIDTTYMEARGKLYSQHPIELWATYEPIASQNFLNALGWDSPDEMIFELNLKSTLKTVGHMPTIGSRIFTPHLSENWEIIQRNLAEFKMWNTLHLQLICKRWQGSKTDGSDSVSKPKTNTINII